jgi:adenine deaminase
MAWSPGRRFNAGDSRLITPETTPASIPTNPATGPLKAATTEPAALLGMEKSLGAVAPGFYADIVAVEGNPLDNITAVSKRENIRRVMKAGPCRGRQDKK